MENLTSTFQPSVDERVLEVYARAQNPEDPFELRDLWLGRVEHELGRNALRPWLAEHWRASAFRRRVEVDEVLTSRATTRFVKELFNYFFRDDLYGELSPSREIVLSSGAVDEEAWGLPETLKDCIRYALDRDWYGYSDSRGRVPAREAVASYESARIEGVAYGPENVALTMGGTSAVSALADFILLRTQGNGTPALCGIPNYPPLVESIGRRHSIRLVPLPLQSAHTSLNPLIAELTSETPLVLIQTVANPTGAAIADSEITRLVRAASPSTMIVLDECHEWLGPDPMRSRARAAANVVRVSSLSKTWSVPGLKIGWILADERLIREYYEYASTTFGGPPSFFYTVVEVLTRMERWLISGLESVGLTELNEFEATYRLSERNLALAYGNYRHERIAREKSLLTLRDATVAGLSPSASSIVEPQYSINIALELAEWNDSYRSFRDLLRDTGVAVFPGILMFCLSGGIVRVTTARRWTDLSRAITRLNTRLAPQGTITLSGEFPSYLLRRS